MDTFKKEWAVRESLFGDACKAVFAVTAFTSYDWCLHLRTGCGVLLGHA